MAIYHLIFAMIKIPKYVSGKTIQIGQYFKVSHICIISYLHSIFYNFYKKYFIHFFSSIHPVSIEKYHGIISFWDSKNSLVHWTMCKHILKRDVFLFCYRFFVLEKIFSTFNIHYTDEYITQFTIFIRFLKIGFWNFWWIAFLILVEWTLFI